MDTYHSGLPRFIVLGQFSLMVTFGDVHGLSYRMELLCAKLFLRSQVPSAVM